MNRNKKEKTRGFQDEIEEFVLSPLHSLTFEEKLAMKRAQYTSSIQSQVLSKKEKQKNYTIPSEGRFDQLLDPTNPKVLSTLLSFLPGSSVLSLMRTCKKLKELLSGIWKTLIEKKLGVNLSSETLFSNPNYMKKLYTSLHFPIEQENLLSSQRIFKIPNRNLYPQEKELQVLMFNLVDFLDIKSKVSLARINSYSHSYTYPTFMLSLEPDTYHISVWLLAEKQGRLISITPLKYKCPREKQILSAKFMTEEYLIIQTREESEDEDRALIEIEVFELASILSQADISFEPQYRVKLQYHNQKSETLVLKSREEMTAEFEGPPSRGSWMNIYHRDRIFFYTKGKHAFLFALNLQKKVLETVYPISLTEELESLFIPQSFKAENSISIFAIDKKANLTVLDYDTKNLQYDSTSLFESEKKSLVEDGLQTYQTGSFIDHKGELHEYLIIFKDNYFYHIDFKRRTARKMIQVCPDKKGELYNDCSGRLGLIRGKPVTNWTVFENMFVILLAGRTVCLYKFTSDDELTRLTFEDFQPLPISYQMKKVGHNWVYSYDIGSNRKRERPLIFLNHCYLMVIQSLSDDHFTLYINSAQALFNSLKKKPEDVNFYITGLFDSLDKPEPEPTKGILNCEVLQNEGAKVDEEESLNYEMSLHKANWGVQTSLSSPNTKRFSLFNRFYAGEKENEVKFQGNSILIYRKGFNIFFNFQSKMNFQRGADDDAEKRMVTDAYNESFLIEMDKSLEDLKKDQVNKEKGSVVPQIKNPHIVLCDNRNALIQEEKEESKDNWKQRRFSAEEKRKEKKRLIKKLINPKDYDKESELYSFLTLSAKERKSTDEELVLRKINKTKDCEKIKRRDQGMMKKSC